jgi:hypothetical protein
MAGQKLLWQKLPPPPVCYPLPLLLLVKSTWISAELWLGTWYPSRTYIFQLPLGAGPVTRLWPGRHEWEDPNSLLANSFCSLFLFLLAGMWLGKQLSWDLRWRQHKMEGTWVLNLMGQSCPNGRGHPDRMCLFLIPLWLSHYDAGAPLFPPRIVYPGY